MLNTRYHRHEESPPEQRNIIPKRRSGVVNDARTRQNHNGDLILLLAPDKSELPIPRAQRCILAVTLFNS